MLWELLGLAAGPGILNLGLPFLGIPADRLSDKPQWKAGKFPFNASCYQEAQRSPVTPLPSKAVF